MKTITKNYSVYTYDELSKEAQEKALNDWCNENEYFFLSDCMNERLHELLGENGIKDLNDTRTTPTQVMYSLSYCQGDGCMFEGVFEWKKYKVVIKHSGHYYHSNSKTIDILKTWDVDFDNEYVGEEVENEFEELYQKICKELEKYGYDFIEYEDSEEHFMEMCDCNEWTFLEDGKMFNQ